MISPRKTPTGYYIKAAAYLIHTDYIGNFIFIDIQKLLEGVDSDGLVLEITERLKSNHIQHERTYNRMQALLEGDYEFYRVLSV